MKIPFAHNVYQHRGGEDSVVLSDKTRRRSSGADLHNFRQSCLNALFLREDKVCEDSMGQVPWRGVARACYRGSHAAEVNYRRVMEIFTEVMTEQRKAMQ